MPNKQFTVFAAAKLNSLFSYPIFTAKKKVWLLNMHSQLLVSIMRRKILEKITGLCLRWFSLIIHFTIFLSAQLPEKYQEVYHDLRQEFVPGTTEGMVQIEFLDAQEEDEQFGGDVFQQRTLEIIQSLRAQNYAYRDMAVLTRSRDGGIEMARFLSAEQIPVISSESLLVSSSAAVQLLVHSLKYIHRPEDAVIASGLRYYHQLACKSSETEVMNINTFFHRG